MSQVSKKYLPPNVEGRITSLFNASIASSQSSKEIQTYLDDLLTETEKVMLAKRFCITFMLLQENDYRTIASTLNVSTGTIGDVAEMLKSKGEGIRHITAKIKRNETYKKVLTEVAETIEEALAFAPGQNWSQSKSTLYANKRRRQKPF